MECLCSPSSRGRALGQGAGTALRAKAVQPDTRFQPLLSLRLKNVGLRSHGAGEGRPHAGEGHGTLDGGPNGGRECWPSERASGQRFQKELPLLPSAPVLKSCPV